MISRREFLAYLSATGVLSACSNTPDVSNGGYDGHVVVIGAGAAGLSAAHFLDRAGVSVQVLEAAATHGGRIKTARDFVDFPIALGGEWLHTHAEELTALTRENTSAIQLAGYGKRERIGVWSDGVYTESNVAASDDLKFVGRTWLDEFLVPSIRTKIQCNRVVEHIDYGGARIAVSLEDGSTIQADKVIVAVPMLQLRDRIRFSPELPETHREILKRANLWGGFKAFFEFDNRFYPNAIEMVGRGGSNGQQLYYDAAFGQRSESHVLGLFSVGTGALDYQAANANGALAELVLGELDRLFGGRATRHYRQHIAQDWSAEPHIGMAYLSDSASWQIPRQFARPIDDKVYFAGDAYIADNEGWSMVHLAARAGRIAVDRILT